LFPLFPSLTCARTRHRDLRCTGSLLDAIQLHRRCFSTPLASSPGSVLLIHCPCRKIFRRHHHLVDRYKIWIQRRMPPWSPRVGRSHRHRPGPTSPVVP
jgi:hypothetical protein